MTNTISETLVPREVVDTLSVAELTELESVIVEIEAARIPIFPLEKLKTENRGLWYLALNDSMKYTLLQLHKIPDAELKRMLEFDGTRLDAYHQMFLVGGDEISSLWSQRFDSGMAAFGNPNITTETVVWLLEVLASSEPGDFTLPEFYALVGDQLMDKWTPTKFNAAVLNELVRAFEFHGIAEYLPKFKHWARKASAK